MSTPTPFPVPVPPVEGGPNHPDYTECTVDGGGLFDELMRAVKSHLELEYTSQKIRGSDYAKVYLGAMEAAMANTTQFLVGNALTEVQKLKILAETAFIALQRDRLDFEIRFMLPLELKKLAAELIVIESTVKKIDAEIELIEEQVLTLFYTRTEILPLTKLKTEAEVRLMNAQADLATAQLPNIIAQTALTEAQVLLTNAQAEIAQFQVTNMMPKELEKITAEVLVLEQQVLVMEQQVLNAIAQVALTQAQVDLTLEQVVKTTMETNLIEARWATEQANFLDEINTPAYVGIPVVGLVGVQKLLLNAQMEGFTRDSETKAARIFADAFAVMRTTDENLSPPSAFQKENITKVVTIPAAGIGAVLSVAETAPDTPAVPDKPPVDDPYLPDPV